MYRPLSYTIKIWATAVLVCPILITLYFVVTGGAKGALYVLLLCIPFGALFSVPSMLLLWLAIHLLKNYDEKNYRYQKLALSAICMALTWLSFFLFEKIYVVDMLNFMAVYAVCTIAGVWIYNLHPKEEYTDDEPAVSSEEMA